MADLIISIIIFSENIVFMLGYSHRNKRRRLTSHIWKEFDPIYDNGMLVEA
jgi:hypothetical protein